MTSKRPPRALRALGPIVLVGTLGADDVAQSAAFFNARYLLQAAATAPIPATKQLGNLTRAFVERAFADMRWPAEYAELVTHMNARLDEPDVWRLQLLRAALQNARLLRKYRGAFSATARGRELLAPGREGELYLELFEAYFEKTNLAFTDGYPQDPWLQHGVPHLLWLLLSIREPGTTIADLAGELIVDKEAWSAAQYCSPLELLSGALRRRILEPLEDFGLITVSQPPQPSAHPWRDDAAHLAATTPLFSKFVVEAGSLN
jgi:hypothetical protein